MTYLQRIEALEKWQEFWDKATYEFFKVEAMQHYDAETIEQSPSYRAWLKGQKEESLAIIKENASEWGKQCADRTDLRKIRIHVVAIPYSEYIMWEIEHYKISNIPIGGEEVYLVNKNDIPEGIYINDFMIFDDSKVADSRYTDEGYLKGMTFYENTEITKYLEAKDILIKLGKKIQI